MMKGKLLSKPVAGGDNVLGFKISKLLPWNPSSNLSPIFEQLTRSLAVCSCYD